MSPEEISRLDKLEEIFFNYAYRRRIEFANSNARLVHYTPAESAISIIDNKELWLRETRCMSDFSEVYHGHRMLVRYFQQDGKRERFVAALDLCCSGAGLSALQRFDAWWEHIQTRTYIGCLSTHHPQIEDQYGRLSMWRAFGTQSGVALVLKMPPLYSAAPLNIYLSPVAYFLETDYWLEIDKAVLRIEENRDLLSSLTLDQLAFYAYRMLVMSVASIKHPVFSEEQEWRLIYLPFDNPSEHVPSQVVTIRGVPQVVHKARFKNVPEANISDISLPDLFERIIIGPTQYPGSIGAALVSKLNDAGIKDASTKVFASNIPLRT